MNEDKKRYTIRIESVETPGGLPTGTVFTMELSPVEADIVQMIAKVSRKARVSKRFDPMISISETIYCDKNLLINDKMPCFSNKGCEECFVSRTLARRPTNE